MIHDLSAEYEYIEKSSEADELLNAKECPNNDTCSQLAQPVQNKTLESCGCGCIEKLNYSDTEEPTEITQCDEQEKVSRGRYLLPTQQFIWNRLLSSVDWVRA